MTQKQHYLSPLFAPGSIVVLTGPSDTLTPQARALHAGLQAQRYGGALTFVNIRDGGVPHELANRRVDLAVIALAPQELEAALEMAGHMRCRAALILGSGVSAQQAEQLYKIAQREGIHLLGPNSLGIQRPALRLNASAAGPLAQEGPLALVCRSGALTASVLDWAGGNAVGFSSVISLGPHATVGLSEALNFLAHDPRTHSIAICLEGVQDARRFMSALRSAASAKPVVVLKAGRRRAGSAAAYTHSSAIAGSDDVFDAALRRAGAVRVRSFDRLFSVAKCLVSRYRPTGPRLAVITNGGGPGVLATDWIEEIGLELGMLGEAARARLAPQLPAQATLQELIDLTEDASATHYRAAVDAALADPGIDGVLALFSPKAWQNTAAMTEVLVGARGQESQKPLLSCWLGEALAQPAREALNSAQIPFFRTPEVAVGAFGAIADYHLHQQMLQQTPPPLSHALAAPDIEGARLLIEGVLAERRTLLTEMESKALLAAFHIPVTSTLLARSSHEAMMIAAQVGFPVALKIDSPDIAHKSDVGGVQLHVPNAAAVREAYETMMQRVANQAPNALIHGVSVQPMARTQRGREVCIGLISDSLFGTVITFGAGGTMTELIDDQAMELPPLNRFLAQSLINRTRVARTLDAWRGAPAVDRQALEQTLLRVSEMACALPQLREMDINPLIVDEQGAVAVDARVVVGAARQSAVGRHGPHAHLSIQPYPARYEQTWPLQGTSGEYLVRPIRPDDAQMLQSLVRAVSSESRYFRFASRITELPPAMLSRFTLIDYDREMALVAVRRDRIIGVARYIINPDPSSCEFGLLVADDYAGQGLGARLMYCLMDVAREQGLSEIQGLVLTDNARMLRLMHHLGFTVQPYPEEPEFRLVTHSL